MKISALIPAAGESRRMGKAKMLLPFRGKTVIETVIKNVVSSQIDETWVVLGAGAGEIEKIIAPLPVHITRNPHYKKGMLSSIQWGVHQLSRDTEAILICLGDQPSIPAETINAVISGYKSSKKGIIVPVFKGKRGHPVLIDLKYRKKINQLEPEIGLRQLVYSHPADTMEVEVETEAVLQDIDTDDDYQKEMKK
ncbi:MAG: molybdenum cofactor cytidylyltransferase [Acidobacteriota bacterium]